tara:strand:- start:1036 stop:1224 length:189 start_codon:yes stop_codon:yes gene_type:complete
MSTKFEIKKSSVSTKYMYEKIYSILDGEENHQSQSLSELMDELALTFKNDTGFTIRSDSDKQ